MEMFRLAIKRKGVLFCLILFFFNLTTGCRSSNESDIFIDETSNSNLTELSKKAFMGLIFGDGEFVKEIPALNNMNRTALLSIEQMVKYKQVEQDVVDYIETHSKNFWRDFYSKISSDDSKIIKSAIKEASILTKEAIESKYRLDLGEAIAKFKSLDNKEKDKLMKSANLSSETRSVLQTLVNDDSESVSLNEIDINDSDIQPQCVYQAVVIVAAGAVAVALYIWAYIARWEAITYPEEQSATVSITEDEIIGQVASHFLKNPSLAYKNLQ